MLPNNDNKSKATLFITNHERQGRYLAKFMEEIKRNPLRTGSISRISIAHDDWCKFLIGGVCNCNPDVQILGEEQ
jgi:hypothetical protein